MNEQKIGSILDWSFLEGIWGMRGGVKIVNLVSNEVAR